MSTRMETERLNFRRFALADVSDVFEYASDEETTKYLTWPTHKTMEQTQRVVEQFYLPNEQCFAIVEKKESKCIGSLNINLQSDGKEASFGLVINRKYWGHGLATEALKFAIEFAFENYGVTQVRGEHFLGNDASGKVMEKAGMKFVGESNYMDTEKIVKVYELNK